MPEQISGAKNRPTQVADWRPTAIAPDVMKTANVVPRIPTIINYNLTNANTWYRINMPTNTVTWMMRARGDYDLHYSFEPSHSNYMTLDSGTTLSENTVPNQGIWAIYVRCATAGAVVELEVWRYA